MVAFRLQQDGAMIHIARRSYQILQQFPGRLNSLQGDVPWAPRSLELSACDFFFW